MPRKKRSAEQEAPTVIDVVQAADGATVIEAEPMDEGEQPEFDFSRFSVGDGEQFRELIKLLNAFSEGKKVSAKQEQHLEAETFRFLFKTCRSVPDDWWADGVPSDPDFKDAQTYRLLLEDQFAMLMVRMVQARGARFQKSIDNAKNSPRL